ncbi:hypothetical protein BDQ12DRAFT_113416 [Crucibulum laeve]|uniref:Uncharacterized protein n=1 Tax=Crucibulum laeve TaxID=68775 RepID=A0A5C3M187_9AGAR|nr:hypothetical protein BDQ12DRAFT_113416 [Crucibulum laeve]
MPDSISDSGSSMFSHSTEPTVRNSRLLSVGENVYVTILNFAHDSALPILEILEPIRDILGLHPQDTGQAYSNTATTPTLMATENHITENHITRERGQHTRSEGVEPTHALSSGFPQLSSTREPNFSFRFTLHSKSCRAYVQRMLPKGLGYPLWEPELHQNLSPAYRRSGVNIGDMVVLTDDGGLDPLFSVYLTHESRPRYLALFDLWWGRPQYLAHELPTDLLFASGSPGSLGTSRKIWPPCTSISTEPRGFDKINAASSDVSFTYCTNKEGAIIFLPTGASQVELIRDKAELLAFIAKNAEQYYAFAKNVVRCHIARDSLYLVTGFTKTSNWGIAMYSECHSPIRNETIKFGKSTDGIYRYDWKGCTASAETKSGPSLNAQFPGKENQCLFLSGYKIALSKKAWSELPSVGETTTISEERNTNLDSSTDKSTGNSQANDQSPSSSGSATSSSTHSSTQSRVQIDAFPSEKPAIFHPSDVINQMLLDEVVMYFDWGANL